MTRADRADAFLEELTDRATDLPGVDELVASLRHAPDLDAFAGVASVALRRVRRLAALLDELHANAKSGIGALEEP